MTKKTTKTDSIKSKLKDGDIVLIKLVYESEKLDEDRDVEICENFHSLDDDECFLDAGLVKDSDIHSILESPLRVGDNVIWNNESCPGTIKAIVDDEAWVEWDNHNGKQIIFLKLLKKIP